MLICCSCDNVFDVIFNRNVPVKPESNGVTAEANIPNSVGILQVCKLLLCTFFCTSGCIHKYIQYVCTYSLSVTVYKEVSVIIHLEIFNSNKTRYNYLDIDN